MFTDIVLSIYIINENKFTVDDWCRPVDQLTLFFIPRKVQAQYIFYIFNVSMVYNKSLKQARNKQGQGRMETKSEVFN